MIDATEAADRLYAVPPRRFVAERTAAVAEARADGDPDAAAALGKLRRPTVAAWLVNLLALRRPELVAELAELAAGLQTAQQDLDGARLRELTNLRRSTVAALVSTAQALALAEDPSLAASKLPLSEVETTLTAALADRALAEQVRSGRLTKAGEHEGFGELPSARLRLVPGGATGESPAAEASGAEPDPAVRQEIAAELDAARSAAEAASGELDAAAQAQQAAKQRLAELDAAIAELTAQRADATAALAEADAASMSARRAVVAARRRVGEAEAAAEKIASIKEESRPDSGESGATSP